MRVVLLPGLHGTDALFGPLCDAFSSAIETTVFDYPRNRTTTYLELLAEIEARLPRNEPFILLGESYGGPLSLMLAARQPKGLCGLVLSASFISCPHRHVPKWVAHLMIPAFFYAAPWLGKFRARFGRFPSLELRNLVGNCLQGVAPIALSNRLREIIRADVARELKACPVPILYLRGKQDYVVPPINLTKIQSIRPDVKAQHFEAPHMILQIQPAAAARAIESFAREMVRSVLA